MIRPKPLKERLLDSRELDSATGCWNWLKMLDRDGYPRMKTGSRTDGTRRHSGAHRISFEIFVGPITAGKFIDHICRNRRCINPNHMRLATPKQNTLENSVALPAQNAKKTHCKRGHPLSGRNLYVNPKGERQCRACWDIRRYGEARQR